MPTSYAAIRGRTIADVHSDRDCVAGDGRIVRKVHFCLPERFDPAKASPDVRPRLVWAVMAHGRLDKHSLGIRRWDAINATLEGCYDDWPTIRREHGAKAVRVMVYRPVKARVDLGQAERTGVTPFQNFAPLLRKRGFRKDSSFHGGGIRTDLWKKDLGNGRILELQLWGDGKHRVSHSAIGEFGRSRITVPTEFTVEGELDSAIKFETDRPHTPTIP